MALWWKKYEPLLEAKALPAVFVVEDLIAQEIVEMYESFPPEESTIQWEDENLARRFRGRVALLARMDGPLVEIVTRMVQWDLTHEIEAIDHYLRNEMAEAATSPARAEAAQFVWPVVLEHLYARKDEATGVLKRKNLENIVEKARVRFRANEIRKA